MNDSDLELVKTAKQTCLSCEGVKAMSHSFTAKVNQKLKGLSGIESGEKGVRMSRDKTGLTFDLYLKVRYGEQIPVLAWNIQKSVKSTLREMTDEKIKAVNIHIQGVDL